MFKAHGSYSCKFLKKSENYTKEDRNGSADLNGNPLESQLIYLHTQLKKAGFRTKTSEWDTYLNYYLEASKRN